MDAPADPPKDLLDAPATPKLSKNEMVLQQLIREFDATTVRLDHFYLVDDPERRKRRDWFKTHKPALYGRLHAAMLASWERTQPAEAPAA